MTYHTLKGSKKHGMLFIKNGNPMTEDKSNAASPMRTTPSLMTTTHKGKAGAPDQYKLVGKWGALHGPAKGKGHPTAKQATGA